MTNDGQRAPSNELIARSMVSAMKSYESDTLKVGHALMILTESGYADTTVAVELADQFLDQRIIKLMAETSSRNGATFLLPRFMEEAFPDHQRKFQKLTELKAASLETYPAQ